MRRIQNSSYISELLYLQTVCVNAFCVETHYLRIDTLYVSIILYYILPRYTQNSAFCVYEYVRVHTSSKFTPITLREIDGWHIAFHAVHNNNTTSEQ